MDPTKLIFKEYYRSLQIVHFPLTFGVLLFTIIATVLMKIGFDPVATKEMNTTLLVIVPIFALTGIFASLFIKINSMNPAKRLLVIKLIHTLIWIFLVSIIFCMQEW